jgi:predicted component of type VI protein secretion system
MNKKFLAYALASVSMLSLASGCSSHEDNTPNPEVTASSDTGTDVDHTTKGNPQP